MLDDTPVSTSDSDTDTEPESEDESIDLRNLDDSPNHPAPDQESNPRLLDKATFQQNKERARTHGLSCLRYPQTESTVL